MQATAIRAPRTRHYVDTAAVTLGEIDCIAIERAINDSSPAPWLNNAEKELAARLMHGQGAGPRTIAARCGITERTAQRWVNDFRTEAGEEVPEKRRRPQGPAACGTRSAYQRHLRRHEAVDDACRAANSAADRRLRLTGTTTIAS